MRTRVGPCRRAFPPVGRKQLHRSCPRFDTAVDGGAWLALITVFTAFSTAKSFEQRKITSCTAHFTAAEEKEIMRVKLCFKDHIG